VGTTVATGRLLQRIPGFTGGIAEAGQHLQRPGHGFSNRAGGCRRFLSEHLILEPALELEHDPGGGLRSDPGHGGKQGGILLQYGSLEHPELGPADDGQPGLGTDSLDREQQLEKGQLVRAEKAKEGEGILAHICIGVEMHLLARSGKLAEGAVADRDLVSDSVHVDDDGLGRALKHGALEACDQTGTRLGARLIRLRSRPL